MLYTKNIIKNDEKKLMNHQITIIIPTLNAEYYIRDLIESIINQKYKADEIIIIDSESEDNTLKIVNNIQNSEISLKLINLIKDNPKN